MMAASASNVSNPTVTITASEQQQTLRLTAHHDDDAKDKKAVKWDEKTVDNEHMAKRTAIGRFGGALSHVPAYKLAALALEGALISYPDVISKDMVQEVILGQVLNAGCGINSARQAAQAANLPLKVACSNVNMVCGSGMKAIMNATQSIRTGDNNVVVAGGMENMSLAPHLIRLRTPQSASSSMLPDLPKFGNMPLTDSLINDGLTDPLLRCKMGDTAEFIAYSLGVDRKTQDEFALRSHMRWVAAASSCRFEPEIVPITTSEKKGTVFCLDEMPRPKLSVENLSKLSPVFQLPKQITSADGTLIPQIYKPHDLSVTAGNASGLNDGAAVVLLASSSFLQKNLKRGDSRGLAKIVSYAQSGGQPALMGLEPVSAVQLALSKAGWSVESVDFWEINEAFAVTTIGTMNKLGIPDWENRVNVNGGAVAMGHPIGASGARIVVTLAHQLAIEQSKNKSKVFRGVATACIGGGQAVAMCLESLADL